MPIAVTPGTLHERAFFDDPWPIWRWLRDERPLFHDAIGDRWILTRYDDVAEVFRDHETYPTKPYQRIFSDVIGMHRYVDRLVIEHDGRTSPVTPASMPRQA